MVYRTSPSACPSGAAGRPWTGRHRAHESGTSQPLPLLAQRGRSGRLEGLLTLTP